MNNPSLKLSTQESLLSSIQTDWQTYRWFAFLIQNPILQRELISLNPLLQKVYTQIQMSVYIQSVLLVATGLVFYYLKNSSQPATIVLGSLASLLLFYFGAFQMKKKNILKICETLLRRDCKPLNFEIKSLYQIAEEYSKTYRIISLVDAISLTDRFARWGFLAIIATASFIFPLKFWDIIITTGFGFILLGFILHSAFIYKNLA